MHPLPIHMMVAPAAGLGFWYRWRVRGVSSIENIHWGVSDLKFMTSATAGAQPGGGTANGSPVAAGDPSNGFDGNPATDFASDFTGYLEFAFANPQPITHISLTPRSGWTTQFPTHLFVDYHDGTNWVVCGEITGLGVPNPGETIVREIRFEADELGGHRWWSINVTSAYTGFTANSTLVELLFYKSGVNIARQFVGYVGSFLSPELALNGIAADDFSIKVGGLPGRIGVDFGRKRVVNQVGVQARSDPTYTFQTPQAFTLDYSDNGGATWTTYLTVNDLRAVPSPSEIRVY